MNAKLINEKLLQVLSKNSEENIYNQDRNNYNNFSYWYPKINGCGIKTAKSKYYIFSFNEANLFCEFIDNKIGAKEKIISMLSKKLKEWNIDPNTYYSLKNGCFSDKFSNCNVLGKDIIKRFLIIQYLSFCYETGGFTELIIREFIPSKYSKQTIYNGLPLRPEFRVFVDFDNNKILYTVNYWDYDYCYPNLSKEDKAVFNSERKKLEFLFNKYKALVEKLVQNKLLVYNSKQKNKLTGLWSIDFMLEGEEIYLIDMALANQSAYWDCKKATEYIKN